MTFSHIFPLPQLTIGSLLLYSVLLLHNPELVLLLWSLSNIYPLRSCHFILTFTHCDFRLPLEKVPSNNCSSRQVIWALLCVWKRKQERTRHHWV